MLGIYIVMCANLLFFSYEVQALLVHQNLYLSTNKHPLLPQQVLCPLWLIVHTDASKILLDSSSTLPLRTKSLQHIAAVSQDEWMTLAADAGALLFRLGIRLPSLAHFWPLGESPVLAEGMLRLTCLVTPAWIWTAALHSMIGICASSHCYSQCICKWGLWGPCVHACKYACSMQCIFVSPVRLFWHWTPALKWYKNVLGINDPSLPIQNGSGPYRPNRYLVSCLFVWFLRSL